MNGWFGRTRPSAGTYLPLNLWRVKASVSLTFVAVGALVVGAGLGVPSIVSAAGIAAIFAAGAFGYWRRDRQGSWDPTSFWLLVGVGVLLGTLGIFYSYWPLGTLTYAAGSAFCFAVALDQMATSRT